MIRYLLRRIAYMLIVIWVLSVLSFFIIQLPAGDFVDTLARQQVQSANIELTEGQLANLRRRFGLDQPSYVQYFRWLTNVLQGDLGYSFYYHKPVTAVIGDRLGYTVIISTVTLLFTYAIGVPIGIYSATRQYSPGDYFFMFIGFIGMATPGFLLALIVTFIFFRMGFSVGGLFSPEYMHAPWSVARVIDFLKHLLLPVILVGTAGTAGLIRVMRASLLDELEKQYVVTARAKGVAERVLLFKYPVRVAINPLVSTIGWELPAIVSGTIIVDQVLGLPTTGPMLYQALLGEDMFLASSLLLFLFALTVFGTFISDILLAIVDPRIRFGARGE